MARSTVEIDSELRDKVSTAKGRIPFVHLTTALYQEWLTNETLQRKVNSRIITNLSTK